jgi:hypothetical protein
VFSAKKERRYIKKVVKRKFAASQEINIPHCGNKNIELNSSKGKCLAACLSSCTRTATTNRYLH